MEKLSSPPLSSSSSSLDSLAQQQPSQSVEESGSNLLNSLSRSPHSPPTPPQQQRQQRQQPNETSSSLSSSLSSLPRQRQHANESSSSLTLPGLTSPMVRRHYHRSTSNPLQQSTKSLPEIPPINDDDHNDDDDEKSKKNTQTLSMKFHSLFQKFHTYTQQHLFFRHVFHNPISTYALKKFQTLPYRVRMVGVVLFLLWKIVVGVVILRAVLVHGTGAFRCFHGGCGSDSNELSVGQGVGGKGITAVNLVTVDGFKTPLENNNAVQVDGNKDSNMQKKMNETVVANVDVSLKRRLRSIPKFEEETNALEGEQINEKES